MLRLKHYFFGAETWTLQEIDKYNTILKCGTEGGWRSVAPIA
jgi:hypothetical protein